MGQSLVERSAASGRPADAQPLPPPSTRCPARQRSRARAAGTAPDPPLPPHLGPVPLRSLLPPPPPLPAAAPPAPFSRSQPSLPRARLPVRLLRDALVGPRHVGRRGRDDALHEAAAALLEVLLRAGQREVGKAAVCARGLVGRGAWEEAVSGAAAQNEVLRQAGQQHKVGKAPGCLCLNWGFSGYARGPCKQASETI